MECLACDEVMEDWLVKKGYAFHVGCGQADSTNGDAEAVELKKLTQQIIRTTERAAPRSKQIMIGPSEIGDDCERRIAYRLLGTEAINYARDPWAAIVGTAVHWWLQKAVDEYPFNGGHMSPTLGGIWWDTEMRVWVNEFISGSTDVYDNRKTRVIDWKTASTDRLQKYRVQGPPREYVKQVNLYGLGHENAGRQVKDVALVFLPRAGTLSGIYVWRDIYRREVAERALARMEGIGDKLLTGVPVEDIPATPSDNCGYCPWFLSSTDTIMGAEASALGCPGR
jgi:hypothetical protein